ncbi:MAG: proline--tRNA ligase [Actinobacteria bacterium]|nr:MAG: proline--tRNA ligase [Actinomycetota bacterium]
MKFSNYFIPTLKEAPSEAEIASHKLLLRAAMIRKEAAGVYSFLPLGKRVLAKVEQIVREEMDRIGSQEILLSILQPSSLWEKSGRWQAYGPEMMRLSDRSDREFALGPTHEEMITELVRNNVRSYRDLPFTLYQIGTKFRDEIRPRFGLMRGREFIMKDAYSFHADTDSLNKTYKDMSGAYGKIVERCGLKYRHVEADSGLIGGEVSEEFMVLASSGEDMIIFCGACGYAANIEQAKEGDNCPRCSGSTETTRGIEIGHIFQLGTKYSEAMGATYIDKGGKSLPIVMGCYGIGVTRLMAAAVEQNNDEKGIIWPRNLSPFVVSIIQLDMESKELTKMADKVYELLSKAGIETIYDDRQERPGVKFADSDLIGFPYQVVIGKKAASQGKVELKTRANQKVELVNLDELIKHIS